MLLKKAPARCSAKKRSKSSSESSSSASGCEDDILGKNSDSDLETLSDLEESSGDEPESGPTNEQIHSDMTDKSEKSTANDLSSLEENDFVVIRYDIFYPGPITRITRSKKYRVNCMQRKGAIRGNGYGHG